MMFPVLSRAGLVDPHVGARCYIIVIFVFILKHVFGQFLLHSLLEALIVWLAQGNLGLFGESWLCRRMENNVTLLV